jgi:hypothetical protein
LMLVAAAMAGMVVLIAVYRVTVDAYGEYAAFGVVGGILVVSAAILAAAAVAKARSLAADNQGLPLNTTEATFAGKRPADRAFHVPLAHEIVCPLIGKLRGTHDERYGAFWS